MNWFSFALLNVLGNGTAFFLYKRAIEKYKLTTVQVLFSSQLVATLIFLPIFFKSYLVGPGFFATAAGLFFFLVATLLAAVAVYFLISAVKAGELSFVGPLENLRPFFVVLFSYFIISEQPTLFLLVGIFLIFAGATFLHLKTSIKETLRSILESRVSLYVTLSAALFGLASIFDRLAVQQISAVEKYVFLGLIGQTTVFFLINLKQGFATTNLFNRDIFVIALLMLVGFVGIFNALALAPASLVVPVQMTRSLYVAILGFVFLKEKDYLRKIIAALLMIAGVFLIVS